MSDTLERGAVAAAEDGRTPVTRYDVGGHRRDLKTQFDLLGLGCTAVDDFLYVAAFPPADAKTRVLRRERHCGGLTATALVSAARLGAKCVYAGVLGEDEQSQFVLDCLQREGIAVDYALRRRGVGPI